MIIIAAVVIIVTLAVDCWLRARGLDYDPRLER